ncbi:MAG: hypothetical protein CL402_06110 [Acidiferrobacteraceae bacterium]|nr:hypothetical protein [Acidiferrobacteraceae bacterium]|tara:strand:+ start:3272 stop:3679 length:408 start_codon:yes stop_codon:yes gene_type:complete
MSEDKPRDILIECQSCGIENVFSNYTPDQFILCNQCRDRLIEPNLQEVCSQFECKDCGFLIVALKKTKIVIGESVCRCGSKNLIQITTISLYREASSAGAFKEAPPVDGDWYRSEPVSDDIENYNKLFDSDIGSN